MTSDDFMTNLVAKLAFTLNIASELLLDQSCLLESRFERCQKCKQEPVTVVHNHLNMKMCDYCAAETIVKSTYAYINATFSDQNDQEQLMLLLMNENNWTDVHDADKIRRVCDYVRYVRKLEIGNDRIH